MKRPNKSRIQFTFALFLFACLVVASTARVDAKHVSNGKIAFASSRDGDNEIFVMNPDGSNQVQLTNNGEPDNVPAWSPDGKKIAFSSFRDSNAEIYVMNADGSNQTRLTVVPGSDSAPEWSPDGARLAFHSQRDGNFEIYVMNADGSGQTRVTSNSASDFYPAWSPDGARIVFYSNRDGDDEIYVMNANGSNQTRLTFSPGVDQQPDFSPDGRKIVFQSNRDTSTPEVFIMNVDGSNPINLSNFPGTDTQPVFSADGKKIIFERAGTDYEIVTMNLDGSNQTSLTSNTASDTSAASQPVPHADTIGVYRPSTSQFLLRNSNSTGSANTTITFGQPSDLPVVGDWSGDGTSDIGVFRNGQFLLREKRILTLLGQHYTVVVNITINFGQGGDLPVAGDWNGDGIDTPGVFRPTTGQWFLTNSPNVQNSSPPVAFTFLFGQSGDTPLAGDWDSNGLDSVGLFRNATANFFLRNFFDGSNDIPTFPFGSTITLPFNGDWNADGGDSIGVFNTSLGRMGLNNTNTTGNGAGDIVLDFGQPGDVPLAGDWDGQP